MAAAALVETARSKLPLDDPQVPRELSLVLANVAQEPLGVLAPDEHFDGIPEWMVEAAALIVDDVDDHPGAHVTATSFVA